jgi:O-antigen/teichoic acid export membrane protein
MASNTIARYFSAPVLSPLLKIASIAYFFRGIFALYRCLLLRDLRYKELSIIDFSGYAIYGVSAIILASNGYGPFSMVWAQCIWSLCLIMIGLWRTRYIPRSFGSFHAAWDLIAFGVWVSIGRVMRNGAGQFDNFVVGKILNATLLGSYYMAQRVVMVIPQAYGRVIDQVMLPIYSKWQDDLQKVEEGYWKVIFYSSVVLVPLNCLIFVFAEIIVVVALGEKWIEIVSLIRIMSVFGLFTSLGDGIFDSVSYGLGRPKIVTAMNTFRAITLPILVIVGSLWGIHGVACGFALYGVVGRFFGQGLLKIAFNFSMIRYLKEIRLAICSAGGATVISMALSEIFSFYGKLSGNVLNTLVFLAWVMIYACLILVFAREKYAQIIGIFISKKTDPVYPAR